MQNQIDIHASLPSATIRQANNLVPVPGKQMIVVRWIVGGVDVLTLSGLKWPLDGLVWKRGNAGVSNLGSSDRVTIKMLSGRLIMVRSLRDSGNV